MIKVRERLRSIHEINETLPQDCIADCTTCGSNDEAVDYWTTRLDFDFTKAECLELLNEYGLDDLEGRSERYLNETLLWLAAWHGK